MLEAFNLYMEKTGQAPVDSGDIGLIARTVYEGLAMKYRYNYERMSRAAGHEVKTLSIIGGGCNNALLNQFTANAMNVRVLAGPGEATAAGNLMMQAVGLKRYDSLESVRNVIRNSFEIAQYLPEETQAWNAEYNQNFLCLFGE